MSRAFRILVSILVLTGMVFVGFSFRLRSSAEQAFQQQVAAALRAAEELAAQAVLFSEREVPLGRTLGEMLLSMGLDVATTQSVIESARPVFNLRRDFRAGQRLAIGRNPAGEFRAVRYRIDADRELWVASRPDGFHAEIKTVPSVVELVGVTGEIRDSLYNAVLAAGESPALAVQLADVFGWDLDFYTDPQPGDRFRLIVEKKRYLDGTPGTYGLILAAEYVNAGRRYQAILFREPSGRSAYYAPDGKSLQKAFLRSPLKYGGRISSRFSYSRFHPVLRRHRPHLGVDYAAPVGTPVQAVGDGRVVFAGRRTAEGKMVHLRHANGYETMYLHLSAILVRPGERVSQGQIIGRVGSTGLSTGPHLDFRVLQHGRYRNFLALQLPPAQPVARKDWEEFVATRDRFLAMLAETTGPIPGTERAAAAAGADTPASAAGAVTAPARTAGTDE
ncbi:MAG: peptidoglycan DD-metalloendopeptidase family protein [Acidobacteriia bacterium]|nr:peptidoglycan DD-metalloendopeptidase family protein [Terriglobia bacterium]